MVEASAASAQQLKPLTGCRVLLADDLPSDQKIFAAALAHAGAAVTTATDGVAAYQKWEDGFAAGHPFHMLVVDYLMPGINGAAVVSLIRAAGFPGPIVGLTAGLRDDEDRLWRSAGCDAVISKSLPLQTFVASVARLRSAERPSGDGSDPSLLSDPAFSSN